MMMLDPSRPRWGLLSKMIIDTTRQLESERGSKRWAPLNCELLEKRAPDVFDKIDENRSGT
jgi:3-polyprenyl-4-hydroxybenzoate decarboxylase